MLRTESHLSIYFRVEYYLTKAKGTMKVSEFSRTIMNVFENVNDAVRMALRTLGQKLPCDLPSYQEGSETILNRHLLTVMMLANQKLSSTSVLEPLFNSLRGGSNFNRLAFAVVGYTAPSIILIRHYYKDVDSDKTVRGIIGAFVPGPWKDELAYQGNSSVVLFTLLPQVKFYPAYKGKGGNSYVYLNTRKMPANSKFKVGLGFGGYDFREFRLWLDDDILDKSTWTDRDDTFPQGYFYHGSNNLKVILFA